MTAQTRTEYMLAFKQKIFENTADAYFLPYGCNQPELLQAQLEAYFWTTGKNHDSLDEYRLCPKTEVSCEVFLFFRIEVGNTSCIL